MLYVGACHGRNGQSLETKSYIFKLRMLDPLLTHPLIIDTSGNFSAHLLGVGWVVIFFTINLATPKGSKHTSLGTM
jgi:hypothetical protein